MHGAVKWVQRFTKVFFLVDEADERDSMMDLQITMTTGRPPQVGALRTFYKF